MVATWKKLAYADEVATLSDETAHDIGTVAAAGVAADASRHDHVHRLGNGAVDTAAVLANDVVETLKIKNANVTTAKLSIDANLNVNKKELTAAALDNQASGSDYARAWTNLLQDWRLASVHLHCNFIGIRGVSVPFDEKEFMKMLFERWEKQWKEEKNERVATIHNALVDAIAAHKGHVDEVIIALEILLQETLEAKMSQIRAESQVAVERLPTEIKA